MSTENPKAFPQHGWSKDPEVVARMQNEGGMTLHEMADAMLEERSENSL